MPADEIAREAAASVLEWVVAQNPAQASSILAQGQQNLTGLSSGQIGSLSETQLLGMYGITNPEGAGNAFYTPQAQGVVTPSDAEAAATFTDNLTTMLASFEETVPAAIAQAVMGAPQGTNGGRGWSNYDAMYGPGQSNVMEQQSRGTYVNPNMPLSMNSEYANNEQSPSVFGAMDYSAMPEYSAEAEAAAAAVSSMPVPMAEVSSSATIAADTMTRITDTIATLAGVTHQLRFEPVLVNSQAARDWLTRFILEVLTSNGINLGVGR